MQFSFQCRLPDLIRIALIYFVSDHAPGGTFSVWPEKFPLRCDVPHWNSAEGKMLLEDCCRAITATNP
jgi:hypothetical protein